MGDAVEGAGGHLDKFIGDGVMALFGIESGLDEGCRQALAASAAMAEALDQINARLAEDIGEGLRMGIGIHAGPCVVGEMGYRQVVSVTAIGDAVNTASRLETSTKQFGCQLVVSEMVVEASGADLSEYAKQSIEVRGRAEAMTVYVVGNARELRLPGAGVKPRPA